MGGGGIPACIASGIPACLAAGLQGEGWYPSMPSRFPGPSLGGKLRGLAGGRSPGPHQGGVSQHALRQTPPPDGYCCRRYASYWNAFLLKRQGASISVETGIKWKQDGKGKRHLQAKTTFKTSKVSFLSKVKKRTNWCLLCPMIKRHNNNTFVHLVLVFHLLNNISTYFSGRVGLARDHGLQVGLSVRSDSCNFNQDQSYNLLN